MKIQKTPEEANITSPQEKIVMTEDMKKTQATRIKNLFTKHKQWLQTTYKTADFKEPIMFLERRSGDVEFYENATQGVFEYEHSDGNNRFIILTPNSQRKYGFADKRFRGYYCHEDYPVAGMPDPYITAEQVNIIVEKSLNDIKKWKTAELKATSNLIWTIAISIAIIIGLYIGYKILFPTHPVEQQATQAVATVLTTGQTPIPTQGVTIIG